MDISGNLLFEDDIHNLAQALEINYSLKSLHLESCNITDVGLEYLANSLQHNNSLKELDLGNLRTPDLFIFMYPNIISKEGISAVTENFKKNHYLLKIVLPTNSNEMSSISAMQEAINEHIEITGNIFSSVPIHIYGYCVVLCS